MAKKKVRGVRRKAEKQPGGDEGGTVNYSTRFTSEQRKMIDLASKLDDCSPAKLIREASVHRAGHVINAAGEARIRLQYLAGRVTEQLLNPRSRWRKKRGSPGDAECEEVSCERSYREAHTVDDEERPEDWEGHLIDPDTIEPIRPPEGVLAEIKMALEVCGTELIQEVLNQWVEGEAGGREFRPSVRPSRVLRSEDDEE